MSQITRLLRDLIASGLSQSEIARRTKIPQPRLSRWVNGAAPDSADDALTLRALHERECPRPGGKPARKVAA